MKCGALFSPVCIGRDGEWPPEAMCTNRPTLCRKCNSAKVKQYYRDNPEKRSAVRRRCNKRSYWNNVEKRRAAKREYAKRNKQAVNRRANNRKTKLKTICQITDAEWREVLDTYGHRCLACGSTEDVTRDHVVPISKGGEDTAANSQPLCRSCNASKGAKTIDYRT